MSSTELQWSENLTVDKPNQAPKRRKTENRKCKLDWELYKPFILDNYYVQKKTANQVMIELEHSFGFRISLAQFKHKLQEWKQEDGRQKNAKFIPKPKQPQQQQQHQEPPKSPTEFSRTVPARAHQEVIVVAPGLGELASKEFSFAPSGRPSIRVQRTFKIRKPQLQKLNKEECLRVRDGTGITERTSSYASSSYSSSSLSRGSRISSQSSPDAHPVFCAEDPSDMQSLQASAEEDVVSMYDQIFQQGMGIHKQQQQHHHQQHKSRHQWQPGPAVTYDNPTHSSISYSLPTTSADHHNPFSHLPQSVLDVEALAVDPAYDDNFDEGPDMYDIEYIGGYFGWSPYQLAANNAAVARTLQREIEETGAYPGYG